MNRDNRVADIGQKDVMWNYLATFLQIGGGLILLPFILRMLPSETVGIWQIFNSIILIASLFDFGFNPSFTRNITYIFSGAKCLQRSGLSELDSDRNVDYSLLKGTISAMKWFYSRIALILLVILLSFGTVYMFYVLKGYSGDGQDVYVAWFILCALSSYDLYTLYYDSLIQGKGLVKRSKQIRIVGQVIYLGLAIVLIYCGLGLIAIISAQAVSLVVKRWLSYKVFFTSDLKSALSEVESSDVKGIIKTIYPNAVKLGVVGISGFLVLQSATMIAPAYISLSELASYGTTMQIIGIITSLSAVYFNSYTPKMYQYSAEKDKVAQRSLYVRCSLIFLVLMLLGGSAFVLFGERALILIKSDTQLLPPAMIVVATIIKYLERNHGIAAMFLLSKNEVPYFKASIVSGVATVVLLLIMLHFSEMKIWAMIIAPGVVQLVYQNWKWPSVVIKDLEVFRKVKR